MRFTSRPGKEASCSVTTEHGPHEWSLETIANTIFETVWCPGVTDAKSIVGDAVEHPGHYTSTVPGIEAIQVTQHFNFNRGNAIKYLWRAGSKGNEIEDLRKAKQYIEFEIARLQAI